MNRLLLAAALLLLVSTAASAQWYPPPAWGHSPRPPHDPSWITVGGYLSFGYENHDDHAESGVDDFVLAGIFADFTRHPLRPGFDLRGQGGNGVQGTLLGPRVSYNYRTLHPYAEFLLGPNHYPTPAYQVSPTNPAIDRHGLTAKAVAGLDLDVASNVSWRVIEYSVGNFSGIPDSHPQSFSTGIVIRVP